MKEISPMKYRGTGAEMGPPNDLEALVQVTGFIGAVGGAHWCR